MEEKMTKSGMLVSSTNTLFGWEIENYLGIVSAHIVTGTGIFSDFAAGLSDFFGGRSGTYQKQLQQINDEAIDSLKMKARKLGANAIIGICIDHDEISGKGTQMFMVSVYGTAVIANPTKESKVNNNAKNNVTSYDELDNQIIRKRIIIKSQEIPNEYSQEEWDFILTNNVYEIASNLVKSIDHLECRGIEVIPDERKKWVSYFMSIDSKKTIDILYD